MQILSHIELKEEKTLVIAHQPHGSLTEDFDDSIWLLYVALMVTELFQDTHVFSMGLRVFAY